MPYKRYIDDQSEDMAPELEEQYEDDQGAEL